MRLVLLTVAAGQVATTAAPPAVGTAPPVSVAPAPTPPPTPPIPVVTFNEPLAPITTTATTTVLGNADGDDDEPSAADFRYDKFFEELREALYWQYDFQPGHGGVPDFNRSHLVDPDAYQVNNVCGKMSNKRATRHEWHVFAETPEICCKICQYVSRCKMWTWSNGDKGHYKKCWITTSFTWIEPNAGFMTGVTSIQLAFSGIVDFHESSKEQISLSVGQRA